MFGGGGLFAEAFNYISKKFWELYDSAEDEAEKIGAGSGIALAEKAGEVLPPEQKFRDQTMAMGGQPVLRGRQKPASSTMHTVGRAATTPQNRKYGSRTSLLTG